MIYGKTKVPPTGYIPRRGACFVVIQNFGSPSNPA